MKQRSRLLVLAITAVLGATALSWLAMPPSGR